MSAREISERATKRAMLALKLRREGLTFREIGERIIAAAFDEPLWVTLGRWTVKAVCLGFLVWWVTS